MVVGSGWGYVTSGFLGENLSVFSIFSQESFLWFRHLCLHGQVGRHSQLIKGGSSKRSDETRAALLNVVDNKESTARSVKCSGDSAERYQHRLFCSSWFRVVSFQGFIVEAVGRVFLVR